MKTKLTILSGLVAIASQSFGLVSLDFTNFAATSGATTSFSSTGDSWISTNVIIGSPATQADAVFTITDTDDGLGGNLPTSTVGFVDEAGRGNNARVRVGSDPSNRAENAFVYITINFYEAGTFGTTNVPYTWGATDELITQFSDLDSDAGWDRSDFAGAADGSYTSRSTSDDLLPGDSLITFDDTEIGGYDIAHLKTPWGPKANVSDTSAAAQSPVTAAFFWNASPSLEIIVGQLSNGPEANRHIDIDMTPDFTIVPEPSALAGIFGLAALLVARRRS